MKKIILIVFLMPLLAFSQANFEKAEKLYRQQKYDLAKPIFESVLAESPNHAKTLEYLGDIEGMGKSWDKAMAYFGKLKKLHPSNADYCYKYGGCLGMKAKESNKLKALAMIGEIRSSFEKAIQLDPNHIEARWALIELYLQLPGIVGGSQRKAEKYAIELLKISQVDGHLAKGHIAEYFKRYKEAEKHYSKAIAVSGSKTTYQKLADLYKNKMNQPQKAKTLLETYQERNKS
jgi:tetratricopeptide (TPR) repeat protein